MKFLLDANLPSQLASEFIAAGQECVHVEAVMPRYSAGLSIARQANESGAVLVTRDADFVQLSKDGVLTVPLIWVRLGNLRRAAIASALRTRLPKIVGALEAGERVVEVR